LKRDFLTGEELGAFELGRLLDRAAELKAGRRERLAADSLAGRSVALFFEKPSTRTRISFEVGVAELGATPVVLRGDELQLSRGESIGDTARVLSRYVDAIVIRSGSHEAVAELAAAAEVPVVNALTPLYHPCQALADLLTLSERVDTLQGRTIAFVGDGNNVAHSLLLTSACLGSSIRIATPKGYEPNAKIVIDAKKIAKQTGARIELFTDPRAAVAGVDAVYTDAWASMGQEHEAAQRAAIFQPYQVNRELLAEAAPHAAFMHCLPAHRGEEVTDEVIDSENSVVFEQADNRLHVQKSILYLLLGGAVRLPVRSAHA
jgi:ornithine carbamoyltransferase